MRVRKCAAAAKLVASGAEHELVVVAGAGIERDQQGRKERAELAELREGLSHLTQREREVLALVVAGLLNKQIALRLGASEKTIKIHRSHVMQKMGADSLADLVRMSQKLGIDR